MNVTALIRAMESQKKREGDLSPTLKTVFFEGLKNKYNRKTIKEVLLSYKGGSWGNDYFTGSVNAKVLRSPDIRFGFIDIKNAEERYFTQKEFGNFSLKNNDILVIKSNGSLDLVGKSQIYKSDKEYSNVIASNFLMVLSPNETIIHPEYLDLFLKSPESLVWRFDTQKTTTGLRNLNSTEFLNIEIPVPDTIQEQINLCNSFNLFLEGKISNEEVEIKKFYTLSKIKEALSNELTHQLFLVKKLRQQLLQDSMQGKLVKQNPKDAPASELLKKINAEKDRLIKTGILKKGKELAAIKEEEIPFEIPGNWVWCKLGEIAYITSGSTPAQSAFVDKGIPYLKMYNLRNQLIDFFHKPQYIKEEIHNGQLKRCRAYSGDILMNIVGPPLGKIAIIPDDLPECNFNQAAVLIRPFIKQMNFFISWYLNEMSEINSIDTKGIAGQANISVTQAHNMRVPLPPLKEQTLIAHKLNELMQNCDALEESIKQSAAQNEKLLQQVLREALRKGN